MEWPREGRTIKEQKALARDFYRFLPHRMLGDSVVTQSEDPLYFVIEQAA